MRDFFETQKHIIIVLIVIIAITIISGYFSSSQPLHDTILTPSSLNNRVPTEELREKSELQIIPNGRVDLQEEPLPQGETQEQPIEEIITIPVTLSIREKAYALPLPEQSSVYDLMSKAREVYGISFGGREYAGLGFFVKEIEGVKNNANGNGKYWIYSINGEKANVGISQYILQDGDIISWNYEDEME